MIWIAIILLLVAALAFLVAVSLVATFLPEQFLAWFAAHVMGWAKPLTNEQVTEVTGLVPGDLIAELVPDPEEAPAGPVEPAVPALGDEQPPEPPSYPDWEAPPEPLPYAPAWKPVEIPRETRAPWELTAAHQILTEAAERSLELTRRTIPQYQAEPAPEPEPDTEKESQEA